MLPRLRLQGGALEQQSSVRLEPPVPGARAVAASSTPERSAVLWSDGTVAVYAVPGDKQPLLPLPAGDSRQPVAKRRLAGYRLAAAGKQKGGGSGAAAGKKRGAAAADADVAAGSPSMAAVSDKQVALAGWATSSEGGGSEAEAACCCCCCTCCGCCCCCCCTVDDPPAFACYDACCRLHAALHGWPGL